MSSVTRFGKILPLRQKIISLGQCCKGLFSVMQNFVPTLEIFCARGPNFIVVNGKKIEQTIWPSGHIDCVVH